MPILSCHSLVKKPPPAVHGLGYQVQMPHWHDFQRLNRLPPSFWPAFLLLSETAPTGLFLTIGSFLSSNLGPGRLPTWMASPHHLGLIKNYHSLYGFDKSHFFRKLPGITLAVLTSLFSNSVYSLWLSLALILHYPPWLMGTAFFK